MLIYSFIFLLIYLFALLFRFIFLSMVFIIDQQIIECSAQSVTWNPHKLMGTLLQCSTIHFKEDVSTLLAIQSLALKCKTLNISMGFKQANFPHAIDIKLWYNKLHPHISLSATIGIKQRVLIVGFSHGRTSIRTFKWLVIRRAFNRI